MTQLHIPHTIHVTPHTSIDDIFDARELEGDNVGFGRGNGRSGASGRAGIITESELKLFFRCAYAYYLRRYVGFSKIPRSAFACQSMLFERARKALFNLRDSRIGRIFPFQSRACPELKMAEEMTRVELAEYLASTSAGAFGRALFGKWLAISKNGTYAGSPIVWSFTSQPHFSATQLRAAGENYYNFVLDNGAPVFGFINVGVSFNFDGHTFGLELSEVRKKRNEKGNTRTGDYIVSIDDQSMWGFNADVSDKNKKQDIAGNSLITLRLLAFCTLVHQFPHYRLKFGIPDEIADEWGGSKMFLDGRVRYRHFNATANRSLETTRTDNHLDRLKAAVDKFLEGTSRDEYAPNHRYCASCPFNALGVNGDKVCPKIRYGIKPAVPYYYFRKKKFSVEIDESGLSELSESPESGGKIIFSGIISKEEGLKRRIATYTLALQNTSNADGQKILVTSTYTSDVRGLEFEQRILAAADKRLQQLADERGTRVAHEINFAANFKFAGQEGIESMLKKLGYEHFRKEYAPTEA